MNNRTSGLTIITDDTSPSRNEARRWGTTAAVFRHSASSYGLSVEFSQVAERTRRTTHYLLLPISSKPPVSLVFPYLADKWKQETRFHSSVTAITSHPAYREIISLGTDAVPYILADLQEELNLWFEALTAITQEQPIPEEHAGDIEAMAADWLAWGNNNGLIKVGRGGVR